MKRNPQSRTKWTGACRNRSLEQSHSEDAQRGYRHTIDEFLDF